VLAQVPHLSSAQLAWGGEREVGLLVRSHRRHCSHRISKACRQCEESVDEGVRRSKLNAQAANASNKMWSRSVSFARTNSDGVGYVRDGAVAIAVLRKHVKAVHAGIQGAVHRAGCDLLSRPLLSRGALSGIDQVGAQPVGGARCMGWSRAREK